MDASLKAVVGADMGNFLSAMQSGQKATKDLNISLGDLEALLKQLKAERPQIFDDNQLRQYNSTIASLTNQIKDLKNAGVQGFDEMGKKISGSLGPLSEMYADIRKIAYIIPGIGIAGIFNLAFEAIGKVVSSLGSAESGLDKQANATKKADDAAKSLVKTLQDLKTADDIVAQASGSQAGGIERVQALANAVRDSNLTYKERITALNELKKTNESYFGDLTLEESSLRTLTTRVQEYSNALIAEAVVKGFTEEISKTTIEYNKQADVLKVLKDKLDAANKAAETHPGPGVNLGLTQGVSSDAQRESNALANAAVVARIAFEKQRDSVEQLGTALATLKPKMDDAILDQLKFKPLNTGSGGVDTKVQDENIQYLEKVKTLTESIQKKDTNPLFKDFAESAEGGLGKVNFQIYQDNLKKATEAAVKGSITADTFEQYATALKNAFDKVAAPNLKSPITTELIDSGSLEKEFDTTLKKLDKLGFIHLTIAGFNQDELKEKEKEFAAIAKKFGESFSSALANAVNQGIEGIATAVATGGNALSVLGRVLGNALKAIGQAYVAAALATAAAKKAFEALLVSNPYAAVAIGIGLELAGSLISAKLSNTKAFASGGIVTGPTNALIGEAGPEVVFPLDKLNQFIRGNTGANQNIDVRVRGVASGRDLLFVHDKQVAYRKLAT